MSPHPVCNPALIAQGDEQIELIHPAPCDYLDLKRRALNGERSKLTDEERAFVVGDGIRAPADHRDAWRSPIASLIDQFRRRCLRGGGVAMLERLRG